MADIGALTLPATPSETAVGDPARQMLADFFAAHLNAKLQDAWAAIGGGTQVVERVDVNDPNDNTFHTNKLPLLCVFREKSKRPFEILADGIAARRSSFVVLWIPPPATQQWKAKREGFSAAVDAAIFQALKVERTPGWKIIGDTDPRAAAEGSRIGAALNLLRPIAYEASSDDITITIEMVDAPAKSFPGVKVTIPVLEELTEDAGTVPNTAIATYRTNGDATTDTTVNYPGEA